MFYLRYDKLCEYLSLFASVTEENTNFVLGAEVRTVVRWKNIMKSVQLKWDVYVCGGLKQSSR